MKKIISTLFISLLGALIALIIHNFYFNNSDNLKLNKEDNVVNISYNPNSKNNSIKSVDFVEAAEKTIHSVVHVKTLVLLDQIHQFGITSIKTKEQGLEWVLELLYLRMGI